MNISTEGLVLRVQKIGEADRLCTLLTAKLGLIRAFSKGAQRMKHKNFPATAHFCYASFELYSGRDRYIIDDTQLIDGNFSLRDDAERMALASYLCDLTITFAPEGQPAADFARLMRAALYYLAADKRPQEVVKAATEMRQASMAGYAPDLLMCDTCGTYEAERMFFLPRMGRLRCINCGIPAEEPAIELVKGSLTALRHTVYADFDKTFAFTLPPEGLAALCRAAEDYIKFCTEREYKTLDIYKSLRSGG